MSSIPVFDISNPLGGLVDQAVAMGYVNEKRTTTKGAAAEFETNIEHAVSLAVDIDPTLDGVSEVKISQSGEDTSDPDVTTISLGSTVYGGSLSVSEEGAVELETQFDQYVFTGSETWDLLGSDTYFRCNLPLTSDKYFANAGKYIVSNGIIIRLTSNGYAARVYINENPSLDTSSDMNTVFTDGTKFTYELATPTTSDLDPIDPIKTLVGENNIWADTGDIEVGYYYQLYQPI